MKREIKVMTFKSKSSYEKSGHVFFVESNRNPKYWSKGRDEADYAIELYQNLVDKISLDTKKNITHTIIAFSEKELNSHSSEKIFKTIDKVVSKEKVCKKVGVVIVGDSVASKLKSRVHTYLFIGTILQNKSSKHPYITKLPVDLKYNVVLSLPSYVWCKDAGPKDDGPNLIGIVYRSVITALTGKTEGSIASQMHNYHKDMSYSIVKNMSDFKGMLSSMKQAEVLSIDTETTSLNRISNKILTVQVASVDAEGNMDVYSLPMEHKETPWDGKQYKVVIRKLKEFFENNTATHVYANAKYDLHQLISLLSLDYYAGEVYDVQAGEFSLEENGKFAVTAVGGWYGLERIEGRYGYVRPNELVIGKDDRAFMSKFSLEEISEYGCLDVVSPYYIMLEQLKIAKNRGYKNFKALTTKQIGSMIVAMTVMEHNGIPIDTDYLSEIASPQGDLTKDIKQVAEEIGNTKAAKKVNKKLAKQVNFSKQGLFEDIKTPKLFNMSTTEHLNMLFFDVLKLEALRQTKNGDNSMDAKFQNRHRHNPIIALYTKYQKITKLKGSFADAINTFMVTHPDMKYDKRLRPVFSFLNVLTGRSCFTGETPIYVFDERGTVPIKDIVEGDEVICVDTKDRYRLDVKRVTKSWRVGERKLYKVTYGNKTVKKELFCTMKHPFLLANYTWVETKDLKKGMKLFSLSDPKGRMYCEYTVKCVEELSTKDNVYDIEVEDNHNFFANGVCVHNSTAKPSTQQIPEHGPYAKIIKKQFKARKGNVLIKADYSGHEVRVSGNIGEDPAICKTVDSVNAAIYEYRIASKEQAEKLAKDLGRRADLHIQNAKTFFNKVIDKDDPLRQDAKAAVFSVLYSAAAGNVGRGMLDKYRIEVENKVYALENKDKFTADELSKVYNLEPDGITEDETRLLQRLRQEVAYLYSKEAEEEYIEKAQVLLDALFSAWHVLNDYIKDQQKEARRNNVIFGPQSRPRHLWGYVYPNKSIGAGMDRRVFNSISQGFASDIGYVGIYLIYSTLFKSFTSKGYNPQIRQCNAVHDSAVSELPYPSLPLAIYLQEHGMLTLNYTFYRKHFGVKPKTLYGFDIDAGINEAELYSYNTRPQDLAEFVKSIGLKAGMPKSIIKDCIQDAKKIGKLRLHELKKNDPEYCGVTKEKIWLKVVPELNMWKNIEDNYDSEGNYLSKLVKRKI